MLDDESTRGPLAMQRDHGPVAYGVIKVGIIG